MQLQRIYTFINARITYWNEVIEIPVKFIQNHIKNKCFFLLFLFRIL